MSTNKQSQENNEKKPNNSFPPGTLLQKRYILDKMVGSGAMGEVYKALDIQKNEIVAVKRLVDGNDCR